MWIRSQGKEVIANVQAFEIDERDEKAAIKDIGYVNNIQEVGEYSKKVAIIGYVSNMQEDVFCLGEYSTKEIALEIMDDIFFRLKNSSLPYQMPIEKEITKE